MMVLGAIFLFSSCASKQLKAELDFIEKENLRLKQRVKHIQKQKDELENEMTFVKGRSQRALPEILDGPLQAPRLQEVPSLEGPLANVVQVPDTPLFEEDISDNVGSLVFTNKDLKSGLPPKASSKKPKSNQNIPAKSKPSKSQALEKTSYQAAYETFKQKKFKQARQEMLVFIQKYPKGEYADNAHFWIGESYFMSGQYKQANTYFKQVVRRFPRGNKVPDAMYRSGACEARLMNTALAKKSFQNLIQKYPTTVAARKAKKSLKNL